MAQATETEALTVDVAATPPSSLRQRLRCVESRLRLAGLLRACGAGLGVLVVGALMGMALDFLWDLPSPARWVPWLGWVGVLTGLMLTALARGVRRPTAVDLAALVERATPELGERLTAATSLLEPRPRRGHHVQGSPALIAAVAAEAEASAGRVDPARVVPLRAAWRGLAAGVVALLGLASLALIWPDPLGALAQRWLMPWAHVERAGLFVVRVGPGDVVRPLGERFTVDAKVVPRARLAGLAAPDQAWLEWTDAASGRARRIPMESASTDGFRAELARLPGSARYRVVAGGVAGASSRWHRVEAVEPPGVARVEARVEAPSYTKRAPSVARDPARIEAWEGSRVVLEIQTTRPVREATVSWPRPGANGRPEVQALAATLEAGGARARVSLPADVSGEYAIALKDAHGIANRPEPPGRLIVVADAPPTVVLMAAEGLDEARPDDTLRVGVSARDDVAVAAAELHYTIERAPRDPKSAVPNGSEAEANQGKRPVSLEGLGTPEAEGPAVLGLKGLGLRPGDVVSYRARVVDNRPAPRGPNEAWTAPRRLTIAEAAPPLWARRGQAERDALKARLEAMKKAAAENRHETELLRYAADAAARGNGTWDPERSRSLADREAAARDVADRLRELARDVAEDPAFNPLERPARQAADVEAEAAREALGQVRRNTDPAQRLADLRLSDARLGALINRIDQLQRSFDQLAHREADRQKIQDLADRQAQLASEAETDTGGKDNEPSPARLGHLEAEQTEVRKELDALLRAAPELESEMLGAQAREADSLATKARDLAARQRDEARRATDLSDPDSAAILKGMAQEQRALEDEARRLALDVDGPLTDSGRARLDPEPLRQAVAPLERADIAAASQRLLEAESTLRRSARDLVDAPRDPKALARRLARSQHVLIDDVLRALGALRGGGDVPEAERAGLSQRLSPLAAREAAIGDLAKALADSPAAKAENARPPFPREAANSAANTTLEAAASLRAAQNVNPREIEKRLAEARASLQRLADAIPDPGRRDAPARQAVEDARRLNNETLRDIERHLRETEVLVANDPIRAANELARRLGDHVDRARRAAARLEANDTRFPPRAEPQRQRAADRSRRLADTLELIRAQGSTSGEPDKNPFIAITEWQVLGPLAGLAAAPVFDLAQRPDPARGFPGRDPGAMLRWTATRADDPRGLVDLGQRLVASPDVSAFAAAEVTSPFARRAILSVGSDDTLRVWINGKRVYSFEGGRGFAHGQSTVEAPLAEGVNRIVVRCGNRSMDWKFAVALSPPPPAGFDPTRARALRSALAAAAVETRAGFERLEQKLQGQVPADDLAAELARESSDPTRPADAKRLAAALRALRPQAPDALLELREALREAEESSRRPVAEASKRLADATERLAARLEDRLSPRARAETLARAERADAEAETKPTARDDQDNVPLRQHAMIAETVRLPESVDALEQVDRAADLARRAASLASANAPPPPTPEELERAHADAATALDTLGTRLSDASPAAQPAPATPDTPRDPDLPLTDDHAARAEDLARRERQLRERVREVLGGRARPQRDLREQAFALGRELGSLRDRARELSPRAANPGNEAASLVGEQAPRAMDDASTQLAQGQPQPARDAQRRAAELAERGAQQAEDLATMLRAEAGSGADAQANAESKHRSSSDPAALAAARQAMNDAARGLQQAQQPDHAHNESNPGDDSLADARRSMRAAADRLQAAADAQGKSSSSQRQARAGGKKAGQPEPGEGDANQAGTDPTLQDPRGRRAGVAAADELREIQELARQKSGRAWGELPGHLRTEILQMTQGRYRDEYARIIQLYFREIAGAPSKPSR